MWFIIHLENLSKRERGVELIYTFTANPTIDYVVNAENFKKGELNRSVKEYKYIGGKGLNVSQVLSNLGVNSTAISFVGGFVGEKIKEEMKKVCDNFFIEVEEDSRINVKVKTSDNIETEINAIGPSISEENMKRLFEKLECVKDGDIVVLAGNVQKSIGNEIYADILKYFKEKNIKCKTIVDAENELLLKTLKYNPFLIKPNNIELSVILNKNVETEEDIINGAKELQKMGAVNVIVSMASKGSIMVTKDDVYKSLPISGKVVNSVGAGDSMVAGYIYKYLDSGSLEEAFYYSNVVGAATAFTELLATKKEVEDLLSEIYG